MSRELAGDVVNGYPNSRLGGTLREIGIILTLALLLSSGKAFNSDPLDEPLRSVFWIFVCTIIMVQIIILWRLFLAKWLDRSMVLRVFGCCLAALLSAALFSFELNFLKTLPISPLPPDPLFSQFIWILPPILIMGLAYAFYGRHPEYSKHTHSNDETQKLLAGPAKRILLPGPVYFPELESWPTNPPDWIEAQDHYLNFGSVHPDRNAFVRGRISDAETNYLGGLRVHRSWWVRQDAISEMKKEGRRMSIVMNDGTNVPVSRRYQKKMVELLDTPSLIIQ